MSIVFEPIGRVENGLTRENHGGWEEKDSVIALDSGLAEALLGLDGFSHLIVLYDLDQVRDRFAGSPLPQKVHPRGRKDMPLIGLFASRTPARPNPLAMTVVRLLKIEGARLTVRGLDAIDGSPVLDIKPYLPANDCVKDPVIPEWAAALARGE